MGQLITLALVIILLVRFSALFMEILKVIVALIFNPAGAIFGILIMAIIINALS